MDTAYKRRLAGGGSRTARKRTTGRKASSGGDNRRQIQLLVSLALFVLVFAGRGVFPRQLEVWKQLTTTDVDFRAAFQQFGQAVSAGEKVQTAFEELCLTVFGGETPEKPAAPHDEDAAVEIRMLGETPGHGLIYLAEHGVAPGWFTDDDQAEPEPVVEPDPEPEVVTAVAQAYTDDGIALPSNVSFAYYNLGLEETVNPVEGTITSTFGYRDSPVNGKQEFHLALDIGASEGTPVGAFAAGTVEYIGESDEFGLYLKINHANNVSSFYAHCSKLLVHKGDVVTCGQTVALVGQTGNATGPHLHLTILKDNIRLDPAYYVDLS